MSYFHGMRYNFRYQHVGKRDFDNGNDSLRYPHIHTAPHRRLDCRVQCALSDLSLGEKHHQQMEHPGQEPPKEADSATSNI